MTQTAPMNLRPQGDAAMSNWYDNILRFEDSSEPIDTFLESHFTRDEAGKKVFDLSSIVPIPKNVMDVLRPDEDDVARSGGKSEWIAMAKQRFCEDTGYSSLFSWMIENVGTKSLICDCFKIQADKIDFQTKLGPPVGAIRNLALLKQRSFRLAWMDLPNFCGWFKVDPTGKVQGESYLFEKGDAPEWLGEEFGFLQGKGWSLEVIKMLYGQHNWND